MDMHTTIEGGMKLRMALYIYGVHTGCCLYLVGCRPSLCDVQQACDNSELKQATFYCVEGMLALVTGRSMYFQQKFSQGL